MSQRSRNTFLTPIVERNHTAIAQRQLKFALTLLARDFTCNRAVYFVGQPVLAGYGFQLEHTAHVFVQLGYVVGHVFIVAFYSLVYHISLRRRTEHLVYRQVERAYTVGLLEGKAMVARGFAYHIHRGTFAFGYLFHMFDRFFFNQQSHTLLRFVGYDFFCRKCFVSDRQLVHVNQSAAILNQFRQAVYVTCRTVVMDGNNRVGIFFAEGAHYIVCAFLHLGVGTLYGIQLDA